MKVIELELMCDLTHEEIQYRAQELGAAIVEQDEVESRRKDVVKEFAEQLKDIHGRMRRLSQVIRTKSERRIVKCAVTFHTPNTGFKQVVRLDTGELCREERMTTDECQQHMFVSSEPEMEPAGAESPQSTEMD
jgi:hypothetical protein